MPERWRMFRTGVAPHPVIRILAALAPVAICLFAGRLGAALAPALAFAVGGAIVMLPPARIRPAWLEGIWLAAAALPLLGFLPATLLPMPSWRLALEHDLGLNLGPFLTPQPYVLLGALVPYWSGLAFLWWVYGQSWDFLESRVLGRTLLAGLSVAAVIVLCAKLAGTPLIPNDAHAALATRNQLATLFATGAVAGAAIAFANRRGVLIFGILATLACLFALGGIGSRGGWCVAGLGIAVALVMLAVLRKTFVPAIASFVLIAGGFAAIVIMPGETGKRFRATFSGELRDDYRIAIQQDAADMLADNALTGVGLGNFNGVFPIYRQRSAGAFRAVHPESDLLWFAGEAGLLAAALALATVAGLCGGSWLRALSDKSFTEIAAIATGTTFVLAFHGLFDVPAHSQLVWYVAACFAGTASFSTDHSPRRIPAWPVALFLAAIAILSLSILETHRPRPFAHDTPLDVIPDQGSIDRWLAQHPLDAPIVELRAHRLAAEGHRHEARQAFLLAERLTPFEPTTAERAIQAWLRAGQPHESAAQTVEFLFRLPAKTRLARLPMITDRARKSEAFARAFARLDPPLAWDLQRMNLPDGARERTLALLAIALAGHRDFPDACQIVLYELAPVFGEDPDPSITFIRRINFPSGQFRTEDGPNSWYEVAEMKFRSGDPEGTWRILRTLVAVKIPAAQP